MFFKLTSENIQTMFRSKSHYIIIYRLPLPSALRSNTKNTCHQACIQTLQNNTTESISCSTTDHLMGRLKFLQQSRWRFTSSGKWSAVTLGERLRMFSAFTFKRKKIKSRPLEDGGNIIPCKYSFGYFPGVRLWFANHNGTPGKYPKEYLQDSKHGESLRSRT